MKYHLNSISPIALLLLVVFSIGCTTTFPNNQAPVANFSVPSSCRAQESCGPFTSTSTDPDGTITGYAWSCITPDMSSCGVGSSQNFSFTPSSAGLYNITLNVTDNSSAQAVSSKAITVDPANQQPNNRAPIAKVSNSPESTCYVYGVIKGNSLTLTAAGSSDPDNDQLKYRWYTQDGLLSTDWSNSETYTITASSTLVNSVGEHDAHLVVEDEHGSKDTQCFKVNVSESDAPASDIINIDVSGPGSEAHSSATVNKNTRVTINVHFAYSGATLNYIWWGVFSLKHATRQENGSVTDGCLIHPYHAETPVTDTEGPNDAGTYYWYWILNQNNIPTNGAADTQLFIDVPAGCSGHNALMAFYSGGYPDGVTWHDIKTAELNITVR